MSIYEPLPKLELDSKRRFRVKLCPCGRNNRDGKFVPYIGQGCKGYCHSCGQTFLPEIEQPQKKINVFGASFATLATRKTECKQMQFIPIDVFKRSMKHYEANNFVKYLLELFDRETATALVEKYFIGTSKHWNGTTIFWQIDNDRKVRTGKVMLYDAATGKRVKEPYSRITWVHKLINQTEYRQCFFGEHLIRNNNKAIAAVESEKTAIIASVYLPQMIWLACSGKDGLTPDKCEVLRNRNVTLFPDLNAFDKWNVKAKEYGFKISDLLERKAKNEEREQGLDLADYLIRVNYKATKQNIFTYKDGTAIELTDEGYPAFWDAADMGIPISNDNQTIMNENKFINQTNTYESVTINPKEFAET